MVIGCDIEKPAMPDHGLEFFLAAALPVLQQLLGEGDAAMNKAVETVQEAALALLLASPLLLPVESVAGQIKAGPGKVL